MFGFSNRPLIRNYPTNCFPQNSSNDSWERFSFIIPSVSAMSWYNISNLALFKSNSFIVFFFAAHLLTLCRCALLLWCLFHFTNVCWWGYPLCSLIAWQLIRHIVHCFNYSQLLRVTGKVDWWIIALQHMDTNFIVETICDEKISQRHLFSVNW